MLQLPSVNFPSGNFTIVKFHKRQLPKGYVKTSELVPQAARGWGRALRLEWARGPSAAARTDFGSCRLGSFHLENYSLGSYRL